jgi:hypothetical protein
VRDRQRPIAKIVPFTVDDSEEDAALVAAGLMRKESEVIPPSFGRRVGLVKRGVIVNRGARAD